MRSINIDPIQFIQTCVENKLITREQVVEALKGGRGLNMPCGHAADGHGHFFSLFFATEKDSPGEVRRSKDGKRLKLNIRASDVKKQQAATTTQTQTPGQALQAAGVNLTPEQQAVLAAVLGAAGAPAAAPQQEAQSNEADFSDLAAELSI